MDDKISQLIKITKASWITGVVLVIFFYLSFSPETDWNTGLIILAVIFAGLFASCAWAGHTAAKRMQLKAVWWGIAGALNFILAYLIPTIPLFVVFMLIKNPLPGPIAMAVFIGFLMGNPFTMAIVLPLITIIGFVAGLIGGYWQNKTAKGIN